MSVCVCVTLLYLKNWTFLGFYTWHLFTPLKWQEWALTIIFSTTLDVIRKGKKTTRCGFFQSSCINEAWVLHHFLNNSCFQQNKLESLNMYTLKVINPTKVSWNTLPPIIIAWINNYFESANNITIKGESWNIQFLHIIFMQVSKLLGNN